MKIWGDALGYPNGSLSQLQTELQPNAPFLKPSQCPELPTLVLSPGGGVNSFMYYGLVSNLASKGYTILALDHPYEPPALLLPNGTTIIGTSIYATYDAKNSSEVETFRISDMQAVASRFPDFAQKESAPFNTTHFVELGHSFGGAAAAKAAATIDGSLGGINLDGAFWKPFFPDVGHPFLIMTSINHTVQFDPSLTKFADKQTSWWELLSVYGSAHLDYSDIGLWPELLGLEGKTLTPQIGPIGGIRMLQIVREYVTKFLSFVNSGSDYIFEHPSLKWKEVIYVNGSSFD